MIVYENYFIIYKETGITENNFAVTCNEKVETWADLMATSYNAPQEFHTTMSDGIYFGTIDCLMYENQTVKSTDNIEWCSEYSWWVS